MIKGSCLCGGIRFDISEPPSSLSYCHCTRCRKAAGVFSAVVIGRAEALRVTDGQELIAHLPPAAPWTHERSFCKQCGTSLGDLVVGDIYVVAASALDDDPGLKPMAHIHVASKPDWYEITDGLPQFAGAYQPEG